MNEFILLHSQTPQRSAVGHTIVLSKEWNVLIKNDDYSHFEKNGKQYLVFGDLIAPKETLFQTKDKDIPKLKGNFHIIVVAGSTITVFTSFFSILPIYMSRDKKQISSSFSWIEELAPYPLHLDKKFILEQLLFNYGLFNRTKYQEIQLLPSNSFVQLQHGTLTVLKHFEITDFFKGTGKPKTANQLSELFIETSKSYFPDTHFDIAFTSGFDGRTLVSCAHYHQKNFATFSFGRPENDDVSIPQKNAMALGIPYRYFDLGAPEYCNSGYLKNAYDFTNANGIGNGFIYAHFPYSAKAIAKKSKYLLSGICGSELFRALHSPGAVTSQAMIDIFKCDNDNVLRTRLKQSKTLVAIHRQEFETELDELVEEIVAFKAGLPQDISLNQKFYTVVFEEIFRKFFGQWVAAQRQQLHIRTPFLDFDFVTALLGSKYAGANNDFFTNNPLKRIKGQLIYADIIGKTNRTIYRQKTGKGYTPRDVSNPLYRINIILPFFKKRLQRKVKKTYLDNLGIVSGIRQNKATLMDLLNETTLFNTMELKKRLADLSDFTPEKERDMLLMSLAIVYNIRTKKTNLKLQSA